MEPEDFYALLDTAWAALDEGEPERALEIAAGAPDDVSETWALRATAALDLGDLEGASAAVDRAALLEEESENAELLCIRAEIELRTWEIDGARSKFQRALALAENPAVFARLALVADLDGDFGGAERLLRAAHKLDAQNFPLPPRMSERETDAVVQDAIARLPEPFRLALERVPVIVEPMPQRELAGGDPVDVAPDVLGLFTGSSLAEQAEDGAFELPPMIHLFQRNIERSCLDRAELVEQVRVTLYHELGHYLGFDEDGVAELGLE